MTEREGILQLDLHDAYQEPLRENVDILLRDQGLTDNPVVRGLDGSKRLQITAVQIS